MKKYEQIEFVTTAHVEIHDVHNSVGLLKQVERLFPLLPLDKLNSRVVKLAQDDGYLVLGDPQLLVIMFVEGIILVECGPLRPAGLTLRSGVATL